VINIILGIFLIIGGLFGNLKLRGTNSGPALAVIGCSLVLWGIARMVRRKS
jgi:hypothetical protein